METYYILPEQHCFIQNISTSLNVSIALVLISFGQLDSVRLHESQLIGKTMFVSGHVCERWTSLINDVSHYLMLDPRRVNPGCVRKLDDEDRVKISMSCFSVFGFEFLPYVSSALDKYVEVEVKPSRHSPPQSSEWCIRGSGMSLEHLLSACLKTMEAQTRLVLLPAWAVAGISHYSCSSFSVLGVERSQKIIFQSLSSKIVQRNISYLNHNFVFHKIKHIVVSQYKVIQIK